MGVHEGWERVVSQSGLSSTGLISALIVVRIPWGTLVARVVRGGQFGRSHPVSLSAEDSCFVVSQ